MLYIVNLTYVSVALTRKVAVFVSGDYIHSLHQATCIEVEDESRFKTP